MKTINLKNLKMHLGSIQKGSPRTKMKILALFAENGLHFGKIPMNTTYLMNMLHQAGQIKKYVMKIHSFEFVWQLRNFCCFKKILWLLLKSWWKIDFSSIFEQIFLGILLFLKYLPLEVVSVVSIIFPRLIERGTFQCPPSSSWRCFYYHLFNRNAATLFYFCNSIA